MLKPGGRAGLRRCGVACVGVLDTFVQAIELLRDPSHVRNYSRAEWEASLVRAGLRPGPVRTHKVRLEFGVWIERMRTPKVQADAIRALQRAMSESVTRYFAIDAEGSFDLDVAMFEATKAGA